MATIINMGLEACDSCLTPYGRKPMRSDCGGTSAELPSIIRCDAENIAQAKDLITAARSPVTAFHPYIQRICLSTRAKAARGAGAQKMNEDPETPILPKKGKKKRRCLGFYPSLYDDEVAKPEFVFSPLFYLSFVAVSLLIYPYLYFIGGRVIDFHKPEFRLDSVYVCPIDTSFVILDLKFDITNTDNHTLCIRPFVVSVFSSSYINRTAQLLTKATVIPTNVCLDSTSHTSVQAFVEDSLSSQITNGTIRIDLKFHALFSICRIW